jgi:hypothetical protein
MSDGGEVVATKALVKRHCILHCKTRERETIYTRRETGCVAISNCTSAEACLLLIAREPRL